MAAGSARPKVLAVVQEVRGSLDLASWGGFATYPDQLRRFMLREAGLDATADLVASGDRLVNHPAFSLSKPRAKWRRLTRALGRPQSNERIAAEYRAAVRRCLESFSPNRPTVVYHQMNSFELPPQELLILGRHHNIRLATTIIDFQELHFPRFFTPHQIDARARNYEVNLGLAASMVTASEFLAENAREIGYGHAPIVVAPLGGEHIPCEHVRALAPIPRDMIGVERFIYMPTTPWKHKGHGRFLEALNETATSMGLPESGVTVVIPGDRNRAIQLLGDSKKLRQLRIHLPGYLEAHTHFALMERATVVAFPSMYEGFGLPYLEAGCLGVALSTFQTDAVCGIYGSLVENFPQPGDYYALANDALTKLCAPESIENTTDFKDRARKFSWSLTAQATLEAYRHAIQA